MELVYLWVDEYKNISNQGFNLSSKFKCDYKADENELIINEIGNKVADIFPQNISVLALIGENGSGKSALAEMILLSLCGAAAVSNENIKNFVVFYDNKNNKFKFSYIGDRYNDFKKSLKIKCSFANYEHFPTEFKKEYFNIYYNPSTETFSSFFKKYFDPFELDFFYILDYKSRSKEDIVKYDRKEKNIFCFPNKRDGVINIRKNHNTVILNMFKAKQEFEEKVDDIILKAFDDNISFKPKKVSFAPYIDEISEFSNKILNEALLDIKDNLVNLYVDGFYECLLILSIYFVDDVKTSSKKIFETQSFNKDTNKKFFQPLYDELRLREENFGKSDIELTYELVKKIKFKLDEFKEFKGDKKLVSMLKKNKNRKITREDMFLSNFYDLANLIDIMEEHKIKTLYDDKIYEHLDEILPSIPYFISVDTTDKIGRKFNDLSNGEKTAIGFVYSLIYYISYYGKDAKEFNIILDEIETAFNPNWQRKLVNLVVGLLENLQKNKKFKNKKFMLTILSHSPFVLSDIPSQNVVFLEKKCNKIEQKYDEIKQTFGANIHTLLSHGFFMKDLVGEFAASKIDEVIKILEQKNLSKGDLKKCENIINIIGEPIVKRQLMQMLDSIRLKKVNEIDTIKNEIKKLENRLKELENGKD